MSRLVNVILFTALFAVLILRIPFPYDAVLLLLSVSILEAYKRKNDVSWFRLPEYVVMGVFIYKYVVLLAILIAIYYLLVHYMHDRKKMQESK